MDGEQRNLKLENHQTANERGKQHINVKMKDDNQCYDNLYQQGATGNANNLDVPEVTTAATANSSTQGPSTAPRRRSRNSFRRGAVCNNMVTKAAANLVKEDEENEETALAGLAGLNMARQASGGGRLSFRRSAVYNSVVTKAAALCVQEEEEDEDQEGRGGAGASETGVLPPPTPSSGQRRRRSEDGRTTPDSMNKRSRRVSNEDPPAEVIEVPCTFK